MATKKKKKKPSKKPTHLAGSRVKLTFSKHFLPPLAGLLVAILVFGFFNSGLISGKIAYYIYEHKTVVPNLDVKTAATPVDKNAPSQVLINKINVTAPVIFDQTTVNEGAFQLALRKGVVHYPNTAIPGKPGNVVIFGHSSGQWWAPGDYKFVFTLLNKLAYGDKVFVDYQGTRYTYQVNNISVVDPSDLSVLNQGGNTMLTLITCTPVGTSAKRLIVQAQQITPDPTNNSEFDKAASLPTEAKGNLPSSNASFWHDFKELFH